MRLDLSFSSPLSGEEAELLKGTIDKFVDLARWGALSGAVLPPTTSGLELDRSDPRPDGGTWWFGDVRLDPAAVCVVLNCLHAFHEDVKPLREVALAWGEIASLSDPLAIRFPGCFPTLPFDFLVGDLEIQPFDIVVELKAPMEIAQVEEIGDTMGIWVSGTNLGAYAFEGLPPAGSRVDFTDEFDLLRPDGIEWYIHALRCSDASLCGLVNLLYSIHYRKAPLRQVRIGDFS